MTTMKEKINKVLLEMYSVEIRGGFGLFDVMIPIAEEIHCELWETDIQVYRQKKEELYYLLFGTEHPHNVKDAEFKYHKYMELLESLLKEY